MLGSVCSLLLEYVDANSLSVKWHPYTIRRRSMAYHLRRLVRNVRSNDTVESQVAEEIIMVRRSCMQAFLLHTCAALQELIAPGSSSFDASGCHNYIGHTYIAMTIEATTV